MSNEVDVAALLAELRIQIGNLSQELAIQTVLARTPSCGCKSES